MKRRYIIAVLLMCMQLTACGVAGENGAETGTSEASSAYETVETTETTVEESSEAETTEAQTEITTETAPDIDIEKVELLSLNDVEAVSGCPEICDTESIKARHKDDVEQFYSSDYGENNKEYSQLAELEMVSPDYETSEYKYIADDFDNDGETEYYLIIENKQNVSDDFCNGGFDDISSRNFGKSVTFYYIEDSGEAEFVSFMNCVSATSEITFYKIADYGSSKHLVYCYWPAYDGVGGSGNARLFDKTRFFDMIYGGVFADGDGILKASTYTLVDEYIWDGADYTAIEYDYDMPDENGELIELDDYHINRTAGPDKVKWFSGK